MQLLTQTFCGLWPNIDNDSNQLMFLKKINFRSFHMTNMAQI